MQVWGEVSPILMIMMRRSGTLRATWRDLMEAKKINNQIYKSIESKSKDSISVFRHNKKLKNTTVVDVKIYTGRTHQIRIHAAQMNHPVLFDNKYGDKVFDKSLSLGNRNIALHSKNIIFGDINSKLINITCENPTEFNELIDKLA